MPARALILLLMLATPLARAATCSVSASDVNLGSYSLGSALPSDGTGNVSVSCTGTAALGETVNAQAKLSAGGSNSYAQRRMSSGAYTVNYNLYSDPTRLVVWGTPPDAAAQSLVFVLPLGLTLNQNLIVYGRAPAAQNPASGVYSDTITVTVTY